MFGARRDPAVAFGGVGEILGRKRFLRRVLGDGFGESLSWKRVLRRVLGDGLGALRIGLCGNFLWL